MVNFFDGTVAYCAAKETDLLSYSGRITASSGRDFIDLVLRKKSHAKNVTIFLTTYGGDPNSAFRMVRCLKKHYSGGKIRLLVDGPCKSAGTLFALGVDEIAIGPRGELGPLDTQMSKQDELIFMNSGLDILQALSVVTSNAFDSCFSNMIEIVKRSNGSISTKTAAEIAASVTTGVFQPITAQIDPLRMGEAHRSMRIAREYGERLKSPLLKQGMLDKLVQDFPSHGFVIDKDEAQTYFSKVDDLTAEELEIDELFSGHIHWPKEDPESFDIGSFCSEIKAIQERAEQAGATSMADGAEVPAEEKVSGPTLTAHDATNIDEEPNYADDKSQKPEPEKQPDGEDGEVASSIERDGPGANGVLQAVNGARRSYP